MCRQNVNIYEIKCDWLPAASFTRLARAHTHVKWFNITAVERPRARALSPPYQRLRIKSIINYISLATNCIIRRNGASVTTGEPEWAVKYYFPMRRVLAALFLARRPYVIDHLPARRLILSGATENTRARSLFISASLEWKERTHSLECCVLGNCIFMRRDLAGK